MIEPDNIVVSKRNLIKIQAELVAPTDITKKEVEEFRQIVLQSEGCAAKRNYAIVTILAYAGLRISECLNIRKSDICLESNQLKVANGKGEYEEYTGLDILADIINRAEDGNIDLFYKTLNEIGVNGFKEYILQ